MDLSILNKVFDKVFLITIDHDFNESDFIPNANLKPTSKNRIDRIKKRLHNLNYEIFYGVNGYKEQFNNVVTCENGYKKVMPQNLTLGQIGCSLSHVKLYEKISNSEWEKVLILEDDCVFNDEILNLETYYSQLPEYWGVVFLGWDSHGIHTGNISKNIFEINSSTRIGFHCTHSIGITKEFAKKMYEFNKEGYYTADGAFNEIAKLQNERIHFITPKLSTQENIDCMSYEIDLMLKK